MDNHTILLVDDEQNVRNALFRALRTEGYAIRQAEGPRQAFEILESEKVDLIISDHKMPRMTGLEFLVRVRENYPDTVRIMLTGHADLETVLEAVNHGEIYRFLTKPWDDEDLKVMIRIGLSHLSLAREHRRLLQRFEKQNALLERLAAEHPGLLDLDRDDHGAIVIDDQDFSDARALLDGGSF